MYDGIIDTLINTESAAGFGTLFSTPGLLQSSEQHRY